MGELRSSTVKTPPESPKKEDQSSEGWKVVGKDGQGQTIQSGAIMASSTVERIFAGRLRNTLKTRQNPGGSVSHEPFFVLPLNVWEGVESLDKALMVFMGKEDASYRSGKSAT